MVLNPDKSFHDTRFSRSRLWFPYENVVIKNSAKGKTLGITIDNKLNFKSRIINICTVANQKSSALCISSNYIHLDKCKLLINAFVKSQFSYCPHLDVLYQIIQL